MPDNVPNPNRLIIIGNTEFKRLKIRIQGTVFLKSTIVDNTVCNIFAAVSPPVRIFKIVPASKMKYSISSDVSLLSSRDVAHLLANCARRVRSEPNESSKSNNSNAGTGTSRNDGGKTYARMQYDYKTGTYFFSFINGCKV